MSQKLEFSGIHLKYRVYLPTLVGSCLRISNISWPPCLANLYCITIFLFGRSSWRILMKEHVHILLALHPTVGVSPLKEKTFLSLSIISQLMMVSFYHNWSMYWIFIIDYILLKWGWGGRGGGDHNPLNIPESLVEILSNDEMRLRLFDICIYRNLYA